MKRCNSKHMRFKGYADGGKIEPTYARAVMARLGVGDGYGNPAKQPEGKIRVDKIYKDKRTGEVSSTPPKRMDVSNATQVLPDVIAKRKKMLDET